jgi:uncharacterized membrane protein YhhN
LDPAADQQGQQGGGVFMSWIFVLAGLFAVLNWYAIKAKNKNLEYIAKPASLTTLLIAYAFQLSIPVEWLQIAFGVGLLLSLCGDIFLMLPVDQFIPGLFSFLLAQLAYIVVFNVEGMQLSFATILMAIAIALITVPVIGSIVGALRKAGRKRLLVPVVVYGIVLSLMFWSAAATLYRPDWDRLDAGLATLGAASFFLSDGILAWDLFNNPVRRARLLTKITYHLAQFALTFGILLHWGFL